MNNSDFIDKYSKECNIKKSTIKGYEYALKKYCEFLDRDIEELLIEAEREEKERIPLKERKLKKNLIEFRQHLLDSGLSHNTVKMCFSKVKSFYRYYEIEIPNIPTIKYKVEQISYRDLPTKKHIREALEISDSIMNAIILFMCSSGSGVNECLSITVGQFIEATRDYHTSESIDDILDELTEKNVIPTFYLERIKTNKYYYTFCSAEASKSIVRYLKHRKQLKVTDKLFDISRENLTKKFRDINDKKGWGFKGNSRFFRPHALRKFHASNLGVSSDIIDELQGRSKNKIHETYIKPNPEELKKIYISKMGNVEIFEKIKPKVEKNEYNITINIFLSDDDYFI